MYDGFVRVAAGTPEIFVADPARNADAVIAMMNEAAAQGVKLLALPELCLTGYTAGDLFLQGVLRKAALAALERVVAASAGLDLLLCVGLPLEVEGRLYNCAAVVKDGALLGAVPKRFPPNYGEFYELRHFAPGPAAAREVELLGQRVPFGGDLIFECDEMPEFRVAVEICEDLWAPESPSIGHALAGATVIVNLSASDEIVGKRDYRELLVKAQSRKLIAGYLYADAGAGESTTDMVFAGHNLIAENGTLLSQTAPFEGGLAVTELDVKYLSDERLRVNTFGARPQTHARVAFHARMDRLDLRRRIDPMPFVPAGEAARMRRCEEILAIQAHGLSQRMFSIGCQSAVIGVSGGLDSTLALIVAARALDLLRLPRENLLAVTMPCFGTTRRTYENALKLTEGMGAKLIEVDIGLAVERHLQDIGHDLDAHDVTYENAQARERTQVLMDIANQSGALVVGTGDLSELALGWATYNGDHMSMYAVNASVPKTLVRHLVAYASERAGEGALADALRDVLNTPVSPELLPPVDGVISQRTEDIVGPYELHDFFLYHLLRRMSDTGKIRRLAIAAFAGVYGEETIDKWLKVFLKRFFSQQFKRSCLPDGPKVGSVALSPRGDWRMPSDASWNAWYENLQNFI